MVIKDKSTFDNLLSETCFSKQTTFKRASTYILLFVLTNDIFSFVFFFSFEINHLKFLVNLRHTQRTVKIKQKKYPTIQLISKKKETEEKVVEICIS